MDAEVNVTPSETANEQGSQSESGQETKQTEAVKAAEVRRLGEQDFDALVVVKINGETQEMTVREALKLKQLEGASHKKMQEASKLVKQVETIITMAKNDPKKFLRETGIDPYDFAESTLAEKFEMMNLSPEQRELMELKKEKAERKEAEEHEKSEREKEYLSKTESEEMGKLDQEIGEAFKNSGLPNSKYYVAQMAARMLSASKQGKNLTAKDAALKVKEEFVTASQEIFGKMDAEAIYNALGNDVMKKIRAFDVKRVTGNSASQQKQNPGTKPASEAKSFRNEHEWRAHLAEMSKNLRD